MLKKLVDSGIKNLKEFYEITSSVEHSGEKGGFREYFVNQLIRPFIPEHFGISSGIVIDADGRQSSQSDVIIYDRRLMPPILKAEGRGIFPIESVLTIIEVKSKLCSSHLLDIALAASKISPRFESDGTKNPNGMIIKTPGTTKDGIIRYPSFTVFAYESDAEEKDEYQRLKEQCPESSYYVNSICVLNKGNWRIKKNQLAINLSKDILTNGRDFLVLTFNLIEEISAERGKFRLSDWIERSKFHTVKI